LLVVGLNSDRGVKALKGPQRPINPLEARALVLAGLHAVDFIAVFDEETPSRLIQDIKPDVLVKGSDYRKDEVVGAEFVESYGGRVHLAPLRDGYSTTTILNKLKAACLANGTVSAELDRRRGDGHAGDPRRASPPSRCQDHRDRQTLCRGRAWRVALYRRICADGKRPRVGGRPPSSSRKNRS